MNAALWIGIGQGIGLLLATLKELFFPYKYKPGPLPSVPVIFFSKDFIRDLKRR
jgi:hypothetical protein